MKTPVREPEDFDSTLPRPPRVALRFRRGELTVNLTGAQLKTVRHRLRLRVVDLAQVLCVNDRTLRRMEIGDIPINPNTARLLSLVVAIDGGADLDSLFALTGLPPKDERKPGP